MSPVLPAVLQGDAQTAATLWWLWKEAQPISGVSEGRHRARPVDMGLCPPPRWNPLQRTDGLLSHHGAMLTLTSEMQGKPSAALQYSADILALHPQIKSNTSFAGCTQPNLRNLKSQPKAAKQKAMLPLSPKAGRSQEVARPALFHQHLKSLP